MLKTFIMGYDLKMTFVVYKITVQNVMLLTTKRTIKLLPCCTTAFIYHVYPPHKNSKMYYHRNTLPEHMVVQMNSSVLKCCMSTMELIN